MQQKSGPWMKLPTPLQIGSKAFILSRGFTGVDACCLLNKSSWDVAHITINHMINNSEYDQEMPQLQTADKSVAS